MPVSPVRAWIVVIQPQTDDEQLLADFTRALKLIPVRRELASFDLRLAT
jgi:hypothetical protein